MIMYKCKCGLLTSEEFQVCPSCGNSEDKVLIDTYDVDDTIYKLTMEDAEYVLDNEIDDDLADKLKNVQPEGIKNILRDNIEIPWTEYIESCLSNYFRDKNIV